MKETIKKIVDTIWKNAIGFTIMHVYTLFIWYSRKNIKLDSKKEHHFVIETLYIDAQDEDFFVSKTEMAKRVCHNVVMYKYNLRSQANSSLLNTKTYSTPW